MDLEKSPTQLDFSENRLLHDICFHDYNAHPALDGEFNCQP